MVLGDRIANLESPYQEVAEVIDVTKGDSLYSSSNFGFDSSYL